MRTPQSIWPGTSAFIHKLAVRRAWAKKGVSTELLSYARARARDLARAYLRLDCVADRKALRDLYASLTPWQKTLVARHPQRPHFSDFTDALITEFTPLAGDRKFGEDEALVGGFGRFRG